MARQSNNSLMQQFPVLMRAWNSPFAFRNSGLLEQLESMGEPGMLSDYSRTSGLEIYEKGNQLVVKAEMPGLTGDDIEVTYNRGVLNIRAAQKEEKEEKQDKEQTRYWSFSQSRSYTVTLPCPVDESNEPVASLENGILTLTFNKPQKDVAKRIQIKSKAAKKENA